MTLYKTLYKSISLNTTRNRINHHSHACPDVFRVKLENLLCTCTVYAGLKVCLIQAKRSFKFIYVILNSIHFLLDNVSGSQTCLALSPVYVYYWLIWVRKYMLLILALKPYDCISNESIVCHLISSVQRLDSRCESRCAHSAVAYVWHSHRHNHAKSSLANRLFSPLN